jgi:3-dehydroquinate synthetase
VLVVADPGVLATLPAEHLTGGLAEAVKGAAVADGELLARIEEDAGALRAARPGPAAALVRRAAALKADVVSGDPREGGRRAILNFGHTVGHALEHLSEYRMAHGDAVATGLRVEARLGEELGVTRPGTAERLAAVLDTCGHRPGLAPEWTADRILAAAATDKKGRAGTARIVLLESAGAVARSSDGSWTHPLAGPAARDALEVALRTVTEGADSQPRPPREGPPARAGRPRGPDA